MKPKGQTLYGHPIAASTRRLTLAEQAYLILREEIRTGHWKVGDRLPSAVGLAQESGLTVSPIRRAFERLQDEGYIRSNGRAGSFLVFAGSKGGAVAGLVGVVVAPPRDLAPDAPWHYAFRLHKVIEGAKRHGRDTEIRYVNEGDDLGGVDRRGALFSDAVTGVICLVPYPHGAKDALSPDRLPFAHWGANVVEMALNAVRDDVPYAHWGPYSSECLPLVGSDIYDGSGRLTEQVISHGHRNIILLGLQPAAQMERESCFLGHEQAMRRAGLKANREAYQRSLRFPHDDPRALRELLQTYGAIPRSDQASSRRKAAGRAAQGGATAVMCAGYYTPKAVVTLAEAQGLRVPEDLSVAGFGHSRLRPGAPAVSSTCLEYDSDQIVDQCFEMLAQQARTRRYGALRILVKMVIEEGHSLGQPRRA